MDSVLRAAAIYVFLLAVFRFAGRRTLNELTTFDFVLLLILGEATQQALLGEDFSLIQAFMVILTLIGLDVLLSELKTRSPKIDRLIEGTPMIIVENGRLLEDRMRRARVDRADVMEAARRLRGLERLDQIKYAILEVGGGITVIAREP